MDALIIKLFTSQWVVFLFVLSVLVAAAEIGFKSGLRFSYKSDEKSRSLLGSFQASVLGLLALLLGFSFSMAVDRYDQRRDLVVAEANTIGTT
jgi:di/tricarboxylate transporter